jgi:hypothetical protein
VVLDVLNEAVLFEFQSYGGPCFNIDSECIYGISLDDSNIFSLDVDTGSSVPCPFMRADTSGGGWSGCLSAFWPAEVVLM